MDLPPGSDRFSDEIAAVAARVAAAREDRLSDLGGLDSEVAALCRRLEAAPHEPARRQLPALRALLRELDLLAAALENAGRAR